MIAGLIHTVPALAGTFDALVRERVGAVEIVHVADAWLLEEAIASGVDGRHDARVAAHVRHLLDVGADAVLVTCSSIGEVADRVAGSVGRPVLRVDRPMAHRAGELARAGGRRIAALATVGSTLAPTGRLLEAEASGCAVSARVVAGALDAKSAGDAAGFARLIAAAVDEALADADAVVLAQASMAEALDDDRGGRVLTSPRSAVEALAVALR